MDTELKKYILSNIKQQYKTFDKGHNINHFNFVTKNCVEYGKEMQKKGFDVDLDIAYIVGAYHDIGLINGRENHAKNSATFVKQDKMLKQYYTPDIINIIAEAVEDHSSHLTYEPRSIYGKIVSDADRNNSKYLVFSRPIKFGLTHEKYRTRQDHINTVYEFVQNKFGRNGYVKYWLDIPQTTTEQQDVWNLLDNEDTCKAYIAGLFDEITKGKYKSKP